MTPEISVQELRDALVASKDLLLLDVREEDELEISRLDGIVHIPMDDVMDRLEEIDKGADIIVVCRTGRRSETITDMLLQSGFTQVRNMVGGMNLWADEIDPTVQKY
jgi:rhodanese-related sulfurtransferase